MAAMNLRQRCESAGSGIRPNACDLRAFVSRSPYSAAGSVLLALLVLLICLPLMAQVDEPAPFEALWERLRAAEGALLEADVERAETTAQQVEEAILLLEPTDSNAVQEKENLLLATVDLLAQCRYTLGDKSGSQALIDRLITLDPGFPVSGEIVGPKYVELFEGRRLKMVGHLRVECSPLPCEKVMIDGREVVPGAEGHVAVAAGEHRVVLTRHGFEQLVLEAVEVAAGDNVEIAGDLEQIARDVIISTTPAGVEVSLGGKVLGSTVSAAAPGASEPFVLESVPPGSHRLILHAPCFQRYEIALEVVLDALDPGPMSFSAIVMEPSHATLDIRWDRPDGIVLLDGKPTAPGRLEVCPGEHEVALSLGGRRAWFETYQPGHEQVVEVAPVPRPSLAILTNAQIGAAEESVAAAWNKLSLDPQSVEKLLVGPLSELLGAADSGVPLYPEKFSAVSEDLAAIADRLAPDADLLAVWLSGRRGVRAVRTLALVDTSRGLVEASSWLEGDETAASGFRSILEVADLATVPFLGLDVAARRHGAPVVAAVHPLSPLEGVAPGMLLLEYAGEKVTSPSDLARLLSGQNPGDQVPLVVDQNGNQKNLKVTLEGNLKIVTPADFTGSFLLPALARSESDRKTGDGATRLSGALRAGMILAVLGRVREAATLLDGADLGEDVDPSQDARGTLWTVLADLMGQLGDGQEYAAEVRARRKSLGDARFGGRQGPALRFSD